MELTGIVLNDGIKDTLIEVLLDYVSEIGKSAFITKKSKNNGDIELCSNCTITILSLTKQNHGIYFIDEYKVNELIEEDEIDFTKTGIYYYSFFRTNNKKESFIVKSNKMITVSNIFSYNIALSKYEKNHELLCCVRITDDNTEDIFVDILYIIEDITGTLNVKKSINLINT